MVFVSVTRLRLRSVRFVPALAIDLVRTSRQVCRAPGFRSGAVLSDRAWAFWTLTAWDNRDRMRAYMTGGAHRAAMPRLLDWCDEASVVHWEQADDPLPPWPEAAERMRREGRPSKVRRPSADHAGMSFPAPRTTRGGTLSPR